VAWRKFFTVLAQLLIAAVALSFTAMVVASGVQVIFS
jgi:hypothetical protein